MQGKPWEQLSTSSRRAVQWAVALARFRAEQEGEDPSSAMADPFDLLVGSMLEHPEDAEWKVLLEHFRIAPGDVLPSGYRRPAPEALERHLLAVPVEGPPHLDPEVSMILEKALDLGLRSGDPKVAELRAVFAVMLGPQGPFIKSLDRLFSERGVNLSEVGRLAEEYVEKGYETGLDFASFLEKRHPFSPQPIDIPNYKADHGRQNELVDDMVGIRAEVDAFAYLLASRGLKPPLAVGLFGDWGSGKSFFMDSLFARIEQLTGDPRVVDRPQKEIPFWKRIVQIRFNAWHYVEGELWASLVDHIFNELRLKDEKDDLVEKRRQHWLAKLDHTRAQLARLELKRSAASRELEAKHQQADLLRRQRDSELARLKALKGEKITNIVIEDSISQVQQALDPLMISVGLPSAGEVFDKLDEGRRELTRGRALLASLWGNWSERALVLGLLVLVPLVVWVLSAIDLSGVATAFSGISAAAAAVIAALGRATTVVRSRLDVLENAEAQVRAEIDVARQEIESEIAEVEKSITDADDRLESIAEEQKDLSDELETIRGELEDITPTRVLTEFVAERVGSGDYRKHLGIPALIQQDFRQLAKLIGRQNKDILEAKDTSLETSDECFNRIILYIDDLDRCPDEHVVEVLQAVHLLLAFELFVVVVAVDSRWLSHALTKHFQALADGRPDGPQATPDDYLEKIFQIPFWIEPLGDDAKRNIVQGLLRGHLKSQAGQMDEEESGDRPVVGDAQRQVLVSLNPAGTPPSLQAAALSITHTELSFLDELAPLLGTTPRSTKRFVNLYQLVRIIYRVDPNAMPLELPPDHELLPFVLAIGEGLPSLGPLVLKAARHADEVDSFGSLLQRVNEDVDAAESRRLEGWLKTRPDWWNMPATRIADAFQKIDRFLFRVGSFKG